MLGSASGAPRIEFDGGNLKPQVQAEDALPGNANYFIGDDPTKWHTHVPLFGKIRHSGVWPGIDVVFYTVASGDIADAGTAPDGVAGFFQVTVKVPTSIPSGPNAVVIAMGTGSNAVSSQKGVTVAVQ